MKHAIGKRMLTTLVAVATAAVVAIGGVVATPGTAEAAGTTCHVQRWRI